MRSTILFFIIFLMCATFTFAQSTTSQEIELAEASQAKNDNLVRLHFTSLVRYNLRTTILPETSLKLGMGYTLIETDVEEIGFFFNYEPDSEPTKIKFEKGKDYYFRISNESQTLLLMIDELTERAFQMQANINGTRLDKSIYYSVLDGKLSSYKK